jgi:hypothetical protein
MSVQSDLDRAYQKNVVQLTEAVVRKTAIGIDADIVDQTPVKTGRARSNWLPSINTPRNDTVEIGQKPEMVSVAAGYKLDDTIFIANNLPYIERLNNGWSGQQPTPSWVEATVLKYKISMKRAIGAIKNGF